MKDEKDFSIYDLPFFFYVLNCLKKVFPTSSQLLQPAFSPLKNKKKTIEEIHVSFLTMGSNLSYILNLKRTNW